MSLIFGERKQLQKARLHIAVLLMIALCMSIPSVVSAQVLSSDVVGSVASADGTPIAHALVQLTSRNLQRQANSDATGSFDFHSVPQGTYLVVVTAAGFARLSGLTIDVRPEAATRLTIQLQRSSTSLVSLGRITTHAGEALSTSSAPGQDLDAQRSSALGNTNVANLISQNALSATVGRPVGGSPNAPALVALRGPDPTETLVELDGHSVNSGGSGTFDLSLLDPAEFSSVQLVYGIAPSSLVGPNTIGGAINLRTLDPTATPHGLARLSFGSFEALAETLQATGSSDRFGYALSLHRTTTQGEVNDQQILTSDGTLASVGSSHTGSDALAKVRYSLDQGVGFVSFTLFDQALSRDLSAALSSQLKTVGVDAPVVYNSFAGSSQSNHSIGYGLDLQVPLGPSNTGAAAPTTLLLRHLTSVMDQSVVGPAASTTPYLFNDHDSLHDDIIELDHLIAKGMLSAKFDLRTERLDTQQAPTAIIDQASQRHELDAGNQTLPPPSPLDGLGQMQRSAALRLTLDPTAQLHYAFALYYSSFSSFGTSSDPRVGLVWTPTAQSALRFSLGTTFQSPQLPELYVPPVLPPPDSNGFIDIGNPSLKADHATDFDLGFEHIFASRQPTRVSVDLYRSNVRAQATRFFPTVTCLPGVDPEPAPQACESFPVNAGDAIYQGIETRFNRNLTDSTSLQLTYTVNSSYPTTLSPGIQGGSIVIGEQFENVPLHSLNLGIDHGAEKGMAYSAELHYEDINNELNRPQFATLQAGATWHVRGVDVGVYGTNLTNVFANRFTLAGRGIPYSGVAGPIPTDAYSLQGRAYTLSITRRY